MRHVSHKTPLILSSLLFMRFYTAVGWENSNLSSQIKIKAIHLIDFREQHVQNKSNKLLITYML